MKHQIGAVVLKKSFVIINGHILLRFFNQQWLLVCVTYIQLCECFAICLRSKQVLYPRQGVGVKF